MRTISAFLLIHFLVATMAPAWIVADFLVERNQIEKDLCVQRMVADGQRTCHGECQLMKRLEKSESQEQNLPAELRAFRISEMIMEEAPMALVIPAVENQMAWAVLSEEPQDGHPRRQAPVPWC